MLSTARMHLHALFAKYIEKAKNENKACKKIVFFPLSIVRLCTHSGSSFNFSSGFYFSCCNIFSVINFSSLVIFNDLIVPLWMIYTIPTNAYTHNKNQCKTKEKENLKCAIIKYNESFYGRSMSRAPFILCTNKMYNAILKKIWKHSIEPQESENIQQ